MQFASKVARRLRAEKPFFGPFTSAQRTSLFKNADRWLYNEEAQHACRYVEFDVEELQQVACNAVGARGCTRFTRLEEGSYNKVFAMKFDNGSEAIARIPSKLAGPPFFTTASEVATSEFAREVLGIPTPRVFAWNGRADRNSIGSEYIIMEKMPGVGIRTRWLDVAGKEAPPIFKDTLKLEKTFESAPFASIGSLYFKEDVSPELQNAPLFARDLLPQEDTDILQKLSLASEKYRIGPITDRQWWRRERLAMTADRGPWPDLPSFLNAAVNLERSWITQYAAQNTLLPIVELLIMTLRCISAFWICTLKSSHILFYQLIYARQQYGILISVFRISSSLSLARRTLSASSTDRALS